MMFDATASTRTRDAICNAKDERTAFLRSLFRRNLGAF